MHVYFVGIGGAGLSPLALIAHQAGHKVSGSDKQNSAYIENLIAQGVTDIHIGEGYDKIEQVNTHEPIDWLVYSSAVPKEQPDHPELRYARDAGIKNTKRDEFISELLTAHNQHMIAIAGTHGKTTTTAMAIWLFQQLAVPASYSVGAKLAFAPMGAFQRHADYFIYEADEYDRNFLHFHPGMSIIAGVGYDHPDTYPTEAEYKDAFREFISSSDQVILWQEDASRLAIQASDTVTVLASDTDLAVFSLPGVVNRKDAHTVAVAAEKLQLCDYVDALKILNRFPGVSRRFEEIAANIYSDYAHTPEKITGAIQLAREVAGDNVVVVYEGLHNTRQHFIKKQLETLFQDAKKLFIVPSYLAREDESLELLTPEKLCEITKHPHLCEAARLDDALKYVIQKHADAGDLVLCLTAGGGGSLDEWLRRQFQ